MDKSQKSSLLLALLIIAGLIAAGVIGNIAWRNSVAKEAYARGRVSLDAGNYRQAIDDFTRAIEYKPRNLAAFMFRGVAYGRTGQRH